MFWAYAIEPYNLFTISDLSLITYEDRYITFKMFDEKVELLNLVLSNPTVEVLENWNHIAFRCSHVGISESTFRFYINGFFSSQSVSASSIFNDHKMKVHLIGAELGGNRFYKGFIYSINILATSVSSYSDYYELRSDCSGCSTCPRNVCLNSCDWNSYPSGNSCI